MSETKHKQDSLVVKVEAENDSDALGMLKQHLLDIGLTLQQVTDLTYYAILCWYHSTI